MEAWPIIAVYFSGKKLLYDLGNLVVMGLGLCVLEQVFVKADRLVPDVV